MFCQLLNFFHPAYRPFQAKGRETALSGLFSAADHKTTTSGLAVDGTFHNCTSILFGNGKRNPNLVAGNNRCEPQNGTGRSE